MGCFSRICAVSKNYITVRDDIVVLFVGKSYLESNYYSVQKSVNNEGALFFPIFGQYNDYGWIENIEKDFNYSFITKMIENEFSDVVHPRTKDKTIFDIFIEESRTGIQCLPKSLVYKSPTFTNRKNDQDTLELDQHNNSECNFYMYHKSVYDMLVKKGLEEKVYIGEKKLVRDEVSNDYIYKAYVSFTEFDFSTLVREYVEGYLAEYIDFSYLDRDDESKFYTHHHDRKIVPENLEEKQNAKINLFRVMTKIFFGNKDNVESAAFFFRDNDNYMVLAFADYLKNDIEKAIELMNSFFETYFFWIGLQKQNMEYDGSCSRFAHEQHPSFDSRVESIDLHVASINQNMENFINNQYDEYSEPEQKLVVSTISKLKDLVSKLENYHEESLRLELDND